MPRKLPALTPDNAPYWQGGEQGVLRIHHCKACAQWFHPPAPICPRCTSFDVEPRAVSGRGTVSTFTVNQQAWAPDLQAPYVVAIIELAEQAGLRVLSNIVECTPESVAIGMPVQVTFEQIEDVWLPLFAPTAESAA
jgi:uncharacterized protein